MEEKQEMKNKSTGLYILLGLSIVLIALGLAYTWEQKKEDEKNVEVEESIAQQFEKVDLDKDGVISLREFAAQITMLQKSVQAKAKKVRLKKFQAQFEAADASKDGYIDADEYTELVIIKTMGENAPAFSKFDKNSDEKLGFREYISFRDFMSANKK